MELHMGMEEVERIKQLLASNKCEFECFEHEEVHTSEDAARVRNSKLSEGVKALVVKGKNEPGRFIVADVPADRKVDLKKLAEVAGCAGGLTMAKPEEVLAVTGCMIGGVPPLGHKSKLEIFIDPSVFHNEWNEFNCGMRTFSVRVKSTDFKRVMLDSQAAKLAEIAVSKV